MSTEGEIWSEISTLDRFLWLWITGASSPTNKKTTCSMCNWNIGLLFSSADVGVNITWYLNVELLKYLCQFGL
jgi:hypothetical protein